MTPKSPTKKMENNSNRVEARFIKGPFRRAEFVAQNRKGRYFRAEVGKIEQISHYMANHRNW